MHAVFYKAEYVFDPEWTGDHQTGQLRMAVSVAHIENRQFPLRGKIYLKESAKSLGTKRLECQRLTCPGLHNGPCALQVLEARIVGPCGQPMLGISVNIVKTQMKIALAHLRKILRDYMVIFLFLTGI